MRECFAVTSCFSLTIKDKGSGWGAKEGGESADDIREQEVKRRCRVRQGLHYVGGRGRKGKEAQ